MQSDGVPANAELTLIGNGRNRAADEVSWNAQWTEEELPTVYTGYKWDTGATKRWGKNHRDFFSGMVDTGYGSTDMMRTGFDDNIADEAQGATYDSGGGVFYQNGSQWALAGIMLSIGTYGNQPSGTAVYGNKTYIADLQYYAGQIAAVSAVDDIDEDGIPDEWEYEKCGTTTGVSASEDQDGDGFDGEAEWIADTDPTDGRSFFQLDSYAAADQLVFSSSTNREYQIQYLASLTNVSWQVETDWFAGSISQTVLAVSMADSNRFYRARVRRP
ncbi:hypothetical protein EGM51_12970 [Verrucomicrobia bacterium S94]|nr:hypothetical protein EGM51_12970 [Verrucomicrobia bacterium S94]